MDVRLQLKEAFTQCKADEQQDGQEFVVCWRNLSYKIFNNSSQRLWRKLQGVSYIPKERTILTNVNGQIQSGQMMAFMGPSGAGKSTLLECIVGKRIKGKSGKLVIGSENFQNFQISFIPQENIFLSSLTVRETILFAVKLQVATKLREGTLEKIEDDIGQSIDVIPGGHRYCSMLTDQLIEALGLKVCENNRVLSCSGGQLKRLAIAQELTAKPRILVLDEPTSGLDSSSCFQVISMLQKLTQQKPRIAILATIHQPSFKLLSLFDKLYVISRFGSCIYEDVPSAVVDTLRSYRLQCPLTYNPADFILEIACGEYGEEVIKVLSCDLNNRYNNEYQKECSFKPFDQLLQERKLPTLIHVWHLFKRNVIITFRDPLVFGVRFAIAFGFGFFLTSVFGSRIGERGGCPPKFDADFEPSQLDLIGSEIKAEIKAIYNNIGNWFFITLFMIFNALTTTCLSFPNEMKVFRNEKENLWYNVKAFYLGKMFSEIPFQLLNVLIALPITYLLQSQHPEFWRFKVIFLICLLVQFVAQSYGYIIGAVFMENIPASVFFGPTICTIPFVLISGVFVKIKSMPSFFYTISYFSYMRFALEGMLVVVYGFNRCGGEAHQKLLEGKDAFIIWMSAMLGLYGEASDAHQNETDFPSLGTPSEKFVEDLIDTIAGDFISDRNEVRSLAMNQYSLEDDYMNRSLNFLVVYLLIVRLIAFIAIHYKSKSNK